MKEFRKKLRIIIFEADTRAGKYFDVLLILAVVASVFFVMLDSIDDYHASHPRLLAFAEIFFTLLFTIEYLTRIWVVNNKWAYIFSFFGIVDLLAILPSYLGFLVMGSHFFSTIKLIRVLRIFRVFKLTAYMSELNRLMEALKFSAKRILVFLSAVLTLVVCLGSAMYVIESDAGGFTSIPRSIYWAVVTLTTVGYGDISPQTPAGQFVAAIIMILGYSLIVVPTGFISVELGTAKAGATGGITCARCHESGHSRDAIFCKYCGTKLDP